MTDQTVTTGFAAKFLSTIPAGTPNAQLLTVISKLSTMLVSGVHPVENHIRATDEDLRQAMTAMTKMIAERG
jgi:hypothetical protein